MLKIPTFIQNPITGLFVNFKLKNRFSGCCKVINMLSRTYRTNISVTPSCFFKDYLGLFYAGRIIACGMMLTRRKTSLICNTKPENPYLLTYLLSSII